MKRILFVAALFFLGSCDSDCCSPEHGVVEKYLGTWVAFEYRDSDGSTFYVTPIPATPAQVLTFRNDGTVSSNIDDLGSARYYDIDIRTDTVPSAVVAGEVLIRTDTVLSLYGRREFTGKRREALPIGVYRSEENLVVHFFCVEGCSFRLRRQE